MTENEKINGWTFEETVKTAENIMEVEQNMFKWDVLRYLRDFAEMYKEELQRYRELGTVEELKIALEKQIPKKPTQGESYWWIDTVKVKGRNKEVRKKSYSHKCPCCGKDVSKLSNIFCNHCGQKLDWSDSD